MPPSATGACHGSAETRTPALTRTSVVALVGNPNTGKTSLFNALTGFHRHVANYPGVTVEVARGPIRQAAEPIELLDLPGTYSLAARSPDEMIVSNVLCGRGRVDARPAAILAIVDAANPVRNFYLISQLLELGRPVVVALNMVDIARSRGISVDAKRLAQRLGVPVVPVVATQARTIEPLVRALESAVCAEAPRVRVELPGELTEDAERLSANGGPDMQYGEALRVLVDQGGYAEEQYLGRGGDAGALAQARQRLRAAGLDPAPVEVRARYAWVNRLLDGAIDRQAPLGPRWSDRIDRLLTHRVAGALALLVVLYAIFYAIYRGASPLMHLVETLFVWLGQQVTAILPDGMLRSLIVDGLIGGVGGVLTFLPQIAVLFFFIAILEDCGYMARAAFMVDRLMRLLGLSGRAFIPLLSSFACAVPAILGTRAIADRRERFITILIAPFMSCSARLPIYVLLIGALVPAKAWLGGWVRLDALVMLGMYLVGIGLAVPIAWILKKTAFAGPSTGFLLELPTYKWPRPRTVWQRVALAARGFLMRAGTTILIVNLVVWVLGYFPRSTATRTAVEEQRIAQGWDDQRFASALAGANLRDSFLGRMGRAIEPVIRPIGWDWRIGIGVLASFPAREVVIATLGTVFNLGKDASEESGSLRQAVQTMKRDDTGTPLFTLPVALSVMVFFALCLQCASTLAVIRKETGSWVWPGVSFIGMTTLAYLAAWGVSAGARALGL